MNDCDIAENCTGNSSQVIFVRQKPPPYNPEITMNVLYSMMYKNWVKSVDAEKTRMILK